MKVLNLDMDYFIEDIATNVADSLTKRLLEEHYVDVRRLLGEQRNIRHTTFMFAPVFVHCEGTL